MAGIAVHTGARVASNASPGEVLVSSTVKDLVAGSGIQFEGRGTRELKGIPGDWQLFAVHRDPHTATPQTSTPLACPSVRVAPGERGLQVTFRTRRRHPYSTCVTMGLGFDSTESHIDYLGSVADALSLS